MEILNELKRALPVSKNPENLPGAGIIGAGKVVIIKDIRSFWTNLLENLVISIVIALLLQYTNIISLF